MTELEYKLTNDVLFKMMFVKYPKLLKRLVAALLDVRFEDIEELKVTNEEMPPEAMGGKFIRLDINMAVKNKIINLEIQVENEGDYPERSLLNWARNFSAALYKGEEYTDLPQTITINIVGFPLFNCKEYHSEFRALEVSRQTLLTDKMSLHYFELPKLPEVTDPSDESKHWLALFKAKTKEDMEKIQSIGGAIMVEAVEAYKSVSADAEFRELARLRLEAKYNEASALGNARRQGREEEKKEIAKTLLAKSTMSVEEIAETTKLTVDDVLKLKQL